MTSNEFHSNVQNVLDRIPRKAVLLIGGVFNARFGRKLSVSEQTIGNHSRGDSGANGNRLWMFAMHNNLSVANTWFRYKPCHTYTWKCREGGVKTEIDYLLVSRQWKSMVEDSRVFREANKFSRKGSDHFFLRTN